MPSKFIKLKFDEAKRKRTGKSIECKFCKKEFYAPPNRNTMIYCSDECYRKDNQCVYVEKVCEMCGKTFSVKKSIEHRYKVCSWACRIKSKKEYTCENCGNKFFSSETRWKPKFCSEKCRRPPIIKQCLTCGASIRVEPKDEDRQFCSLSCYRKSNAETIIERKTRESLDKLGVTYEQEKKFGRYSIDFFIPSLLIALEIDGDYWHKNKERDRKKDEFINSLGISVVRISEKEINMSNKYASLLSSRLGIKT